MPAEAEAPFWFLKLTMQADSSEAFDTIGVLSLKYHPIQFYRVLLDGQPHTYYLPIYDEWWFNAIDLANHELEPIFTLHPLLGDGTFKIEDLSLCGLSKLNQQQ